MIKKIAPILFAALCQVGIAQEQVKHEQWSMNISPQGYLENIIFYNAEKNDTIPFFTKENNVGPRFYIKESGKEQRANWTKKDKNTYQTQLNGVECTLTYFSSNGVPSIKVVLNNKNTYPFQPQKAGLKLGIDTYMDKYPEWFNKYFPTLMYCDKTHFYGYLQTPSQHSLALVSEQPIASWSVDYNLGYQDPAPYWFMGHRIESLNLDLINALPLPQHNPQHLFQLAQGETKTWVLSFVNVDKLNTLETSIREVVDIPLIDLKETNFIPNQDASFRVFANQPQVSVFNDKGVSIPLRVENLGNNQHKVNFTLPEVGLYDVKVTSSSKEASATLLARNDWKWVFENAREATLKYHQKATSHAESWYGFYSAFIAAKEFPNAELDKRVSDRFELLYGLLHKEDVPQYHATRIQNTSTTIGMLVDKYEAFGDIYDLERASKLGDWLIETSQRKDGAYYNHGTIYTSVIYIAKSMLELAVAEKEAGKKDSKWNKLYRKHYKSAKKAIDQLVNSKGDFQTEGEHTFEDGMISCSALQIGMLGTLETNAKSKELYTKAMLDILNSHACLTQLRVPDARRRQGTMRYWEAQYDVQMLPNMFNSPHGWSGWRAYATYYAYLLTGNERWLMETYNAMAAFSNLLDYKTGQLRWAFVVDPHLEVEQTCSADKKVTHNDLSFGNPHPYLYDTKKFVIGEQYVNMISDWQTINTQDNDVHELFKCIGETVLNNAFIVERTDGSIKGYNCDVKKEGNTLVVTSYENQIHNLHTNLQNKYQVTFKTPEKTIGSQTAMAGYNWLFRF